VERNREVDVAIVGAGIAGVAASIALARRGISALLIDPRAQMAPCFKAEKLEPDHADLLRALDLGGAIFPRATRSYEVTSARRGHVLDVRTVEQYGIFYHDLVNALRAELRSPGEMIIGEAVGFERSRERGTLTLADGRCIRARLVVIASGTAARLMKQLAIERTMISFEHSLCFGFEVERSGAFPFKSLSYYSARRSDRFDFLTLFPIGSLMRANLFTYRRPKDRWVRAFLGDPTGEIERLMPELFQVSGRFRVSSKIESRAIDLWRVDHPHRSGAVLIGDAHQSVCPATGTGITKALTDVLVLTQDHAPRWLESPSIEEHQIAELYRSPAKLAADQASMERALYQRRTVMGRDLISRMRRFVRRRSAPSL
jgi:2-polyprenyl-6-methoxyphenol hydroxylase-like FAD-dependent oxidoreductase